jgi:8-oxo-dGTP diphosphatase
MELVTKALLWHGDKILILRRSKTHPNFAYQFDLPGGLVVSGESNSEALNREILEEIGSKLNIQESDLVYTSHPPGHHKYFIYEASLDSMPQITLSWEHDEYYWLTSEQILASKYPDDLDPFFAVVLEYLKSATS